MKTGAQWRWMPHDLPPWPVVYQQTQRWLAAGCFEAILDDLRAILRLAAGRAPEPSAVILDSQTLQSTPDSGGHAGYDGAKRKRLVLRFRCRLLRQLVALTFPSLAFHWFNWRG